MVGEPPQGSQWKSYSFATSRDDYRIGCFQHSLGDTLEQSENRWSVVSLGVPAPYQCQGASGSIPVSSGLAKDKTGIHVCLKIDNLTAVYHINKMGGTHSRGLMEITAQIWEWSIQRGT